MTTSTKELIDWCESEYDCTAKEKLEEVAQRLRELQEELDEYCPRPSNGQTDNTSAGCIKRGECGCHIGREIGRNTQ